MFFSPLCAIAEKPKKDPEVISELTENNKENAAAISGVDKPKKDADGIPLYDGSRVYVSKVALARAYIPIPAIYTSRVTDLVIGKETLAKIARGEELPDKELLQAIITHVRKVFAIRGDQLTPAQVQEFINHKLSTLKAPVTKSGP